MVCREAERGLWRPLFVGSTRLWDLLLPHRSDKAKALPRQCLDEALFLARIADGASSGIQAGREHFGTMRPQMASIGSSLLTTCSRLRIK